MAQCEVKSLNNQPCIRSATYYRPYNRNTHTTFINSCTLHTPTIFAKPKYCLNSPERTLTSTNTEHSPKHRWGLKDWQRDPSSLTTDRVQVWSNGIMLTLIPRAAAQEMVKGHRGFVISEQAVGALDDDGNPAS